MLPTCLVRAEVSTTATKEGYSLQRRLAAILVADVVGYSGLVEADEGKTLSTLMTCRRRCSGR